MLFNSAEFIFVFLPLVLMGFFFLSRRGLIRPAVIFLVLASLFFYGWWKWEYLALLLFCLGFNYWVAMKIIALPQGGKQAKAWLAFGVTVDIALIAYYKYTNFGISIINEVYGTEIGFLPLMLPLGISFFVFQKIAYLVDTYKGLSHGTRFLDYCLFVTFFPQLIAGPIVHYSHVIPQFEKRETFHFRIENLMAGLFVFSAGLFKKAVLADNISGFASPVFQAADSGQVVSTFEAWGAALAYTLQLYFDFSGYSDMAIGLGLMFGVHLPLNFHSPYKARSIIDFWRRWHMTLSRFLRDYVYIPLGGNRKGALRRHYNLFLTMLIGGLWHGAGVNFVIWGGAHGLLLVMNHVWKEVIGWIARLLPPIIPTLCGRFFKILPFDVLLTFFCVLCLWVFFRATTLDGALSLLKAMFLFDGLSIPRALPDTLYKLGLPQDLVPIMENLGLKVNLPCYASPLGWITAGIPLFPIMMAIVWFLPNSYEACRWAGVLKGPDWQIEAGAFHSRKAIALMFLGGMLFFFGITTILSATPSEFLYFNF